MGVLFLTASDLCGKHIGIKVGKEVWHPYEGTETRISDPITMITHKKNGHVIIRHGTSNRQWTLPPNQELFEVKET